MRKIIVSITTSLDGYVEGPGREIDWHMVDEELHRHFNDRLRGMSAFISGRVTWELMAGYWPTADADPDSTPAERDFAGVWREMPKIVFSRTLPSAGWNTEIRREVVAEEIRELKERPGGDMVLGGPDLAASFRALDLIDEYSVYVDPILLGRGKPLFTDFDHRTALTLAETRTFGNGVVLLRYERDRS
ncbi:dihydrofolate reductase family protein [Actinomadura montaniterrae]|uniref:Dihydrofolate reductase family protein n=1 Tax=Actinomadura montaniterrae TaxID=1803903 RepID=A0A6L3VYP4_9ACTN|nr:dihydrofolate reductase family protein [Actinomadura montaniterrae]KAB2378097.1 dihydrofolate reductase family protein [Actinomadura montaniterrae]